MISTSDYEKINTVIEKGFLVVYPTDTLYALGASVFNESAVQQVFSLKQRPLSLPLPIAVPSFERIHEVAEVTPLARVLATHFLPGSLTLVLKNRSISSLITGNKDTIAVRIPDDEIALYLLNVAGPLTVTSANIHQHPTPFTIPEIQNTFKSKRIAMFIDDGVRDGQPSTIVDATSDLPVILREGSISSDEINTVVSTYHG